jgi:colanic acid/amylovoran biosynthesis protein
LSVSGKAALVRAIKASQAVISSGGGFFWSDRRLVPGPMFLQSLLHLRLAAAFHKPVVFFPQSFGPLASRAARSLLGRALRAPNVRKIFARETESFDFVGQLLAGRAGALALTAPDMAFALDAGPSDRPAPAPVPEDLPRPVVALTLRRWNFPEARDPAEKARLRENYLTAMAGLARFVVDSKKGSVIVFCQVRGPGPFEDDRLTTAEFLERTAGRIPGDRLAFIRFPETVHPSALIGLLGKADLTVATRFHSTIFSLLAGTPALALNYQPKSRAAMRDLGLGSFSLDIANLDPDRLIHLAGDMIDRLAEIRGTVCASVALARATLDRRLAEARDAFAGAP